MYLFLPGFLILMVFFNRYVFGLFLRQTKSLPNDIKEQFTKRFQNTGNNQNNCLPQVTVIVPLYNEGQSIYSTLKSLSATQYPPELFSIVVVDDCSKDDSFKWASRAAAEHPCIQIVQNKVNMGKRMGIAHAVRNVNSEIIVSVDSDVIVEPDAILKLVQGFTHDKIAAVGGRVSVFNARQNWLTQMQTVKYWIGYEFLKNLENAFDSVLCLSGCLTAYRRKVLIELEPILMARNILGVPIKYGEDRFLTRQIVKAGYRTKLNLAAECYTKAPATLGAYFAQQLRWRRSNMADFIGALSHIWKHDIFVTLHYLTLYTLILSYPAILWISFLHDTFMQSFLFHLGILSVFGLIYAFGTMHKPAKFRAHPLSFLAMSVILPVTYMVLNILALFTLDSGSWETRKG